METYQKLLIENKAWAQEIKRYNPNFFQNLAKDQSPDFLWIGCSDSRVPANQITNAAPGDMFVHRNIANMVVKNDANIASVVQFAVNHLLVPHVIVCGHYRCGGVAAAFASLEKPLATELGVLGTWLDNLKTVYQKHKTQINQAPDDERRLNTFIECNVKEQVINLSQNTTIQEAWKSRKGPILHGWVYGLGDGVIKEVMTMDPNDKSTLNPD